MSDQKEKEYHFEEAGTIVRPGWIGRFVRFAMGIICLHVANEVLTNYVEYMYEIPDEAILWFFVILAFYLLPPVVNIGFGKKLHSKPQSWFLILLFISVYYGYFIESSHWSTISGCLFFLLPLYVFSHLGLSFVIAAVIGTPGCEMRAIPHLWSIVTRNKAKEHYCPGFIDGVDKWEQKKRS